MAYASFANWDEAPNAPKFMLDQSPIGPGYRAAPQVYHFAPQKLWYSIYQGGDPLYSTTKNLADPGHGLGREMLTPTRWSWPISAASVFWPMNLRLLVASQ